MTTTTIIPILEEKSFREHCINDDRDKSQVNFMRLKVQAGDNGEMK